MMKNIFLVLAFTCSFLFAESVKISNLPVVLPANVTTSDVFPVVNYPSVVTSKLKVSELFSVPSLASPTFTGVVSISNGSAAAPALTFASDTDTGIYRAGANQIGISSGGRQIAYLEDNSGPGVILNPDSTNDASYIYQNANDAMLSISGGVGSASGASQRLYGGTHATKASLHEFYVNSTVVGSHNASGLWTLGASAGSQFHVANGQLLVNGAATSDYTLKVVRGAAGVTNGAATVSIQDVTTNTTAKVAAIGLGRYDNSNKDNALIYAQNDATTATMSLGGGVSDLHAVTSINFYTAANSSTNTGNLVGSISSGGVWTLGLSSGTQTHIVNGQSLRLNFATSGGDGSLQVRHSSNTANSNSVMYLETGGTSGGDPKVQYFVTGGQDWSHGIDNSDSDSWVLSNSATLGTNAYIKVPTTGIVEFINGIRTKLVTANVSSPPTDAELDSAFGAPATVGSGFAGLVNDNAGGTDEYLVWSDGTNWFYLTGVKAL